MTFPGPMGLAETLYKSNKNFERNEKDISKEEFLKSIKNCFSITFIFLLIVTVFCLDLSGLIFLLSNGPYMSENIFIIIFMTFLQFHLIRFILNKYSYENRTKNKN